MLTLQGRKMLARILPTVLAQNERALKGLAPMEVLQLRKLLARMSDNFRT